MLQALKLSSSTAPGCELWQGSDQSPHKRSCNRWRLVLGQESETNNGYGRSKGTFISGYLSNFTTFLHSHLTSFACLIKNLLPPAVPDLLGLELEAMGYMGRARPKEPSRYSNVKAEVRSDECWRSPQTTWQTI